MHMHMHMHMHMQVCSLLLTGPRKGNSMWNFRQESKGATDAVCLLQLLYRRHNKDYELLLHAGPIVPAAPAPLAAPAKKTQDQKQANRVRAVA